MEGQGGPFTLMPWRGREESRKGTPGPGDLPPPFPPPPGSHRWPFAISTRSTIPILSVPLTSETFIFNFRPKKIAE